MAQQTRPAPGAPAADSAAPSAIAARDLPREGGRRVSAMAEGLVGSEILKIAAEIRGLRAAGTTVCNLTVGDFDPNEFRIPDLLEKKTEEALRKHETNYPPSNGMQSLREQVRAFYADWLGLDYTMDSVLVTSGSRPGIYAAYRAVVDPGDRVVYPVPSWNNNHYCYMVGAEAVEIPTKAENAFLPTADDLRAAVRGARLLALNSPVNPCGTAFTAEGLGAICDLVLEENARRGHGERPLFLMYDQVYWMITFGTTEHVDPVSLRPEMRDYTIYVDGISKAFAATGLRVGWALGPKDIIDKMSSIVGHVGAWAPKPEQIATAQLLAATGEVKAYQETLRNGAQQRLMALHEGIGAMKAAGLAVDSIPPMGAIYLSARFALNGRTTAEGKLLRTNEDIRKYLLERAGFAVVPFQAFGMRDDSGWFRLSVGAVSLAEIERVLPALRSAIESLR